MSSLNNPHPCLIPGCEGSRRTRGLCHPHYQNWRAMARKGTCASDSDLEARGLLLPKSDPLGGSGTVVKGSPYFKAGSTLTGDGLEASPASPASLESWGDVPRAVALGLWEAHILSKMGKAIDGA